MGYDDLLHFLGELRETLERLTAVQGEKRDSVQDLEALNECMKREQALSLSLRGMESRREKLLSELGLAEVPLREVPKHCPPGCREEAARAVEQVLRSYEVLRSAQGAARTMLEGRLHQIEGELERRGMAPEEDLPLPAAPRRGERGHTDFKA